MSIRVISPTNQDPSYYPSFYFSLLGLSLLHIAHSTIIAHHILHTIFYLDIIIHTCETLVFHIIFYSAALCKLFMSKVLTLYFHLATSATFRVQLDIISTGKNNWTLHALNKTLSYEGIILYIYSIAVLIRSLLKSHLTMYKPLYCKVC